MSIRILIVDDHPIVREGLIVVLETQSDFAVVGYASAGNQVLDLTNTLSPDVILLDLELPDSDGVTVLQQLRAVHTTIKVIVFTAFDTDERIIGAVRAGAQGYLLKGAPREELFQAIRVVHEGGSLLQPIVAARLLRQVTTQASQVEIVESLTERELEVLHLLATGRQNKEIASELIISERTVKFHVSAILAKLHVGNRTEAVAKAAQLGLITLNEPHR
ncbi:MAG: response regulator [Chloroflexi bacterium AL-W]|nr:response regulator [Chloroflexi bacterium AL-N1]NOK66973.1 response regulator [Chloroflexi bacterium AL-N10]NOK74735.1 response regulator [Chloroflexi bacterium AL-N5]NOK81575.1 response regulator [Chloroflexi bacterium AL-W]NOK89045.1 response regulator [Chloroflexi bacterium AL-N15]